MSFEDLIARLDPRSERRGREFERICAWYLRNAPEYRAQVKQVWLWDEWPGRWGRDIGIDLVVETHDRELWAVQAKAYDAHYAVTKRDVDSFLSESNRPAFAFRLLLATTDRIARNARSALEGQEKPIGLRLRSDLGAAHVAWPSSPERLLPGKPKPNRLYPYQRVALRRVITGFTDSTRGQLVMACGTGKTLVGLHVAEALKTRRVLVLLPSLALVEQTLQEWTANAPRPFSYLAVCSDESVVERDSIVASTTELGVPVTTDPARVAAFLRRRHDYAVVFATYQSSDQIARAQQGRTPAFDLVIADEAHRCAGPEAGVFATVLDPAKIKARKRLFMTATPRFFTGRIRKEAKEADWEIASMDDKSRFGPVLHRLSFGEAIDRGLLSDYQVVVVGVSDATYREYAERGTFVTRDGESVTDARTLASQLGLVQAIRKHDLHRVVTFHSRISNARSFATSLPDVSAWMPAQHRPKGTLWTEHVSGEMSAGDRRVRIARLRETRGGERGVLANARCLTEGVDVPTLDGVAFIDPRRSQIDIAQAVGRAIRKAEDKTVGTIVIPVFVDADGDAEQALESGEFQKVWDVVKALRAHDEVLAEELDEIRRELGRRETSASRPKKIHFDLPVGVDLAFARAFDAKLVESSTARWHEGLGAAQAFQSEHGHLLVPLEYATPNGFRLGVWIDSRRQDRRRGRLTETRIAELDLLGMVWEPHEAAWQRGLVVATAFRRANGHLRVLGRYRAEDGFRLGGWIAEARAGRKRGTLAGNRIAELEQLDMDWDANDAAWRVGIAAARDYRERHGDLRPPAKHVTPEGFRLGAWLADKRSKRRRGQLNREQIAELDALGIVWEPHDERWRRGIAAARRYRSEYGHLDVPQTFVTTDGYPLGVWLGSQRTPRIRQTLSASRVRELDALGMVWDPLDDRRKKGIRACRAYRAKHGNLDVPASWVSEDGFRLGGWISRRRADHRSGKLDAALMEELDHLGMVWQREDPWQNALAAARAYREAMGHLQVPQKFVADDGTRLGQSVANWRTAERRGTLDPALKDELDSLGMAWDAGDEKWERGLGAARAYREAHDHLRVPNSFVSADGFPLGSWLNSRRQQHRRRTLQPERIAALEALDVIWAPLDDAWERGLGAARAYREAHGHLLVPASFVDDDGFRLGSWINHRRTGRKQDLLTPERIAQLDALGMVWEARVR